MGVELTDGLASIHLHRGEAVQGRKLTVRIHSDENDTAESVDPLK